MGRGFWTFFWSNSEVASDRGDQGTSVCEKMASYSARVSASVEKFLHSLDSLSREIAGIPGALYIYLSDKRETERHVHEGQLKAGL